MKEKPDKRRTKKSKAQIKERSRFAMLNGEWNELSYEQKLAWLRLAKQDSVKRSSSGKNIKDAQNLFLSLNGYMYEMGEPIMKEPPVLKDAQVFIGYSVDVINARGKNEMKLNIKEIINNETKLLISSSPALNIGGPTVNKRDLRRIAVLDSNFKSGDSILAQYLRVFKRFPQKGEVIGFQVLPVNRTCGKIGLAYPFPVVVK